MAGRSKKGGARIGSGRKSKAEEQQLAAKLKPYETKAHAKLKAAVEKGERWAIELFFAYLYGKPTQRTELTGKDGGALSVEHFDGDALRDLYTGGTDDGD